MKKRNIITTIIILLLSCTFTGCAKKQDLETAVIEPDFSGIQGLNELSTVEYYYHNVAKGTKEGSLFKQSQDFWIEYDGIVSMGINMDRVRINRDGLNITVEIPEAEVFDVSINIDSFNEDSFITSYDTSKRKLFQNTVKAEDTTAAIKIANENMKIEAQSNSTLLRNARNKAQDLIKNFIEKIGEERNETYYIVFKELEELPSTEASSDVQVEADETM